MKIGLGGWPWMCMVGANVCQTPACMAVLYICVLNLVTTSLSHNAVIDELSTKFTPSNGGCLPRSLRVLPMSLAVKICFGNVVISMKGVLAPGWCSIMWRCTSTSVSVAWKACTRVPPSMRRICWDKIEASTEVKQVPTYGQLIPLTSSLLGCLQKLKLEIQNLQK